MNTKTAVAVVLVLAAVLVVSGIFLSGMVHLPDPPGARPEDPLVVAYSPFESTALFWIAEEKGFFRENGINITLKKYDSGSAALGGVMKGEAEISVGTTEFPLLGAAFRNESARALATMDKGEFIWLVARQDRIRNATDLRGKRIGTTRGTIADYHLGRYLMLHGISPQDVAIVDVRTPAGWVNEVADGNIDAISTAQPYADAARRKLGGNAVMIPVQSGQPLFALVISTEPWIASHRDTAGRFIAALVRAEEYADEHPSEAREIVRKRLELEPEYMDTVWQQNRFSITLDQSLVSAMEAEARWMIAGNLTSGKTVPDIRGVIDGEILQEIRPGSVRIIG